jgi:NAD(P)H-dependent flavin oxidoreductase YrpB (nitropropane dioxygenase family)
MLSGGLASPDTLRVDLDRLQANTSGPFGVNFLMPFVTSDMSLIEIAASRARVVEFFYGAPDSGLVDVAHAGGALCSWQVGSATEAQAAEQAGCDFIIIQGVEAGGHVRGSAGLLPVLNGTLTAVGVPVLAAGGLATGRDVAAMLSAGAAGCRIGTRLVCTHESNAHEDYKQALVAANAEDTAHTEAFSVMWPDAPHRVLQSAVVAMENCEDEVIGECDISGKVWSIARGSVIAPTRESVGNIQAMALYAGQSVGNIHSVDSVAEVMRELVDDATRYLSATPR